MEYQNCSDHYRSGSHLLNIRDQMQRRQAPGNTVNILGPSLAASLYSFVGYAGNMWRADHVFHLEQRVRHDMWD